MLVSLSLSPASTAAKNDRHWAFLEEIDAPRWADLKAEEALARAGTIGDDPWLHRSHSHHEVPLTEIIGAQVTGNKDRDACVRRLKQDRKKSRGILKGKLAFDGAPGVKCQGTTKEERHDQSPRAVHSPGRYDTHVESPIQRIASPILCRSPENLSSSRRFTPSATFGNLGSADGLGVLQSSNLRFNFQDNQNDNGYTSVESDVRGSQLEIVKIRHNRSMSVSSVGKLQGDCEHGNKVVYTSVNWQDAIFSRLNDSTRLRKSLGSALRVKIDVAADTTSTNRQEAAILPKARLVRQSMQLDSAVPPATSSPVTRPVSLESDHSSSNPSSRANGVRSSDGSSCLELANESSANSSVQAFDDIRRMRKSWGPALRVIVGDDLAVEDVNSEHEVSEVPPVSNAKVDRSSLKLDKVATDCPSTVDLIVVQTKPEEKFADVKVPAVALSNERRPHHHPGRKVAFNQVKDLEQASTKVVAARAKMNFRRSFSFDHTSGRGTEKTFTSSRNLLHQKQASRTSQSPSSRSSGLGGKVDKVSRLSKRGKENASIDSSNKTNLNPEPSAASPRMSCQSATRMSMPSITFAAHARVAMRENGGSNPKPCSSSVVEIKKAGSSKVASSTAVSAARKSVSGLENGTRKKTIATPGPVTNLHKAGSRQSALRSSMPVFSSVGMKQASKTVSGARVSDKKEEKMGGKIVNGDADLAALLAEHNRKFQPKPKYEPRIHPVKDIKEWETRTGQLFYNLPPAEREKANIEISAAKQTRQKQVPC